MSSANLARKSVELNLNGIRSGELRRVVTNLLVEAERHPVAGEIAHALLASPGLALKLAQQIEERDGGDGFQTLVAAMYLTGKTDYWISVASRKNLQFYCDNKGRRVVDRTRDANRFAVRFGECESADVESDDPEDGPVEYIHHHLIDNKNDPAESIVANYETDETNEMGEALAEAFALLHPYLSGNRTASELATKIGISKRGVNYLISNIVNAPDRETAKKRTIELAERVVHPGKRTRTGRLVKRKSA